MARVREAPAVDSDAVRICQDDVRARAEDIDVALNQRRVRARDLIDDRACVDADVVEVGAGFRDVEQ